MERSRSCAFSSVSSCSNRNQFSTITAATSSLSPAGMNKPAAPLLLSHDERNMLTKWAHSATAPHRVVTRAKALLMAGDGVANTRIATTLGIGRPTVLNWRGRFLIDGLDSVGEVRTGRGRKPAMRLQAVRVPETEPGLADGRPPESEPPGVESR